MAQPAYTLETGPATEPVSRAEAKRWLRIDDDVTDHDDEIDQLVSEARARAERVTGRALVTQTWKLRLDRFPCYDGAVFVNLPPLASVSSITYVDTDGATQTLSAALYQVDAYSQPGRIAPAYDESWPDTREQLNAVTITFVAGVAAASVDPEFLGRMKACVAYCFRNRERRDEAYLDGLFSSLWCGTY